MSLLENTNSEVVTVFTWKNIRQFEEDERQRRLFDRDECVARKVNGKQVADAIRVDASTIKARFVNRPSLWQQGKKVVASAVASAPTVAASAIHEAPTIAGGYIHSLQHAAAEKTASAWNAAYGTARNVAAQAAAPLAAGEAYLGSYIPSLSSLLNTANSIKETLVNTVHSLPFGEVPTLTLEQTKLLEEDERQRRITEDADGNARANAKRVSRLIEYASKMSTLKLLPNNGFNKYMGVIEERERTRRLANKHEADVRRYLACRIANQLNLLGWPFIRSAKGGKHYSPFSNLAEEERSRLLLDEHGMFISRYNANRVAAQIKEAFQPKSQGVSYKYTRALEEKERKYRIKNVDPAIHNAHKEAHCIADIGAPFYIAPGASDNSELFKDIVMFDRRQDDELKATALPVIKQDKEEKKPLKKQLAQESGGYEIQDIALDTSLLEETERKSRCANKDLQRLAMTNAATVSRLIRKSLAAKEAGKAAAKSLPVAEFEPFAISPGSLPLSTYEPLTRTHPTTVYIPPIQTTPIAQSTLTTQPAPLTQASPNWHPALPTPSALPTSYALPTSQALPSVQAPATQTAPAIPYAPVIHNDSNSFVPIQNREILKVAAAPNQPSPKPAPRALPAPSKIDIPIRVRTPVSPTMQAERLLDSARKLYEKELDMARKEREKANSLRGARGLFSTYRLRKHESAAEKHEINAKIHKEWLRKAEARVKPTAAPAAGLPAY